MYGGVWSIPCLGIRCFDPMYTSVRCSSIRCFDPSVFRHSVFWPDTKWNMTLHHLLCIFMPQQSYVQKVNTSNVWIIYIIIIYKCFNLICVKAKSSIVSRFIGQRSSIVSRFIHQTYFHHDLKLHSSGLQTFLGYLRHIHHIDKTAVYTATFFSLENVKWSTFWWHLKKAVRASYIQYSGWCLLRYLDWHCEIRDNS